MRRALRTLPGLSVVALLSALPTVALAQNAGARSGAVSTADESDVEFTLGNKAYQRGDFRKALSHYFASNRLVFNRNVLFNIGRCYENLKQYVEAYRYYQLYLQGAKRDTERAEIQKAMDRIKGKVGLLRISTTPPGATIYLNRKNLGAHGTTPRDLAVKPGTYRVILERDGYRGVVVEKVQVSRGGVTGVKRALAPRLGTVSLNGKPAQVTLKVDDQAPKTVTLPTSVKLPLGAHTFRVTQPGFEPRTARAEVSEDRTTTLDVSLTRQTGSLVVQSSELNAAVYVDGALVGFAPTVIPSVEVGEHTVEVRQEGFGSFRQKVKVTPKGRVELRAELAASTDVAAASREVESSSDAPASISLVSLQELRAFRYTGTRDALTGTRGLYFNDDRTYLQPGIRGYSPFGQFGNRLLVQIDGHTMNENWLGASFQELELLSDLQGMERIEVVRGPGSVLYGSGAFFGVVNLVTPNVRRFSSTRIGVTGVDDGVGRAYAHVRRSFKDGGILLSAGLVGGQPRDYYAPSFVGSDEAPDGTVKGTGGLSARTARVKVEWKALALHAHWHDRDRKMSTAAYETIIGDPRTRQQDKRAYVDLRFSPKLGKSARMEARLTYDYYGFEGDFPYADDDGGLYAERYNGHWAGLDLRFTLNLWKGGQIDTGVEAKRHFMTRIETTSALAPEDNFTLDDPYSSASVHAILRQKVGTTFSLSAGARLDAWAFDGLPDASGAEEARTITSVNPRLALIWKPAQKNTIKLLAGRAFRAPSIYELTYNDGGITQVPSPQLEPETTFNTELEYTRALPKNFELVGSTYLAQISSRIEQEGEGDEMDPLRFVNADTDLWTVGGELELRRAFRSGWMFGAQYSFQRTREGSLSSLTKGDPIPNSPSHLASARVVAPIVSRALSLATRASYMARRKDRDGEDTRPVILLDVAVSGKLAALPLTYSLGARNLLDWQYNDPVGDDIPDVTLRQRGRTFTLDVGLEF